MRECGSVGVRECGSVGVWECGCVVVWWWGRVDLITGLFNSRNACSGTEANILTSPLSKFVNCGFRSIFVEKNFSSYSKTVFTIQYGTLSSFGCPIIKTGFPIGTKWLNPDSSNAE